MLLHIYVALFIQIFCRIAIQHVIFSKHFTFRSTVSLQMAFRLHFFGLLLFFIFTWLSLCRYLAESPPKTLFYKNPLLPGPLFVFQWLFDEAQMDVDNVGAPVTKQQWDYIHKMGDALRQSFENVTAVFAPSCISHCVLTKRDWQSVKIDDISIADALHCWERKIARRKFRRLKHMFGDQPKSGKRGRTVERLEKKRSEDKTKGSDRNVNDAREGKKGRRRRKNKRKRKGGHKGKECLICTIQPTPHNLLNQLSNSFMDCFG